MGILYIVATPIGNLADITLRALDVLKQVDLVVCEDTRQTIKLLNYYQISKPLVSYFQHSKLSKIDYIVEQLAQGKKVALVTDAGTPGISDPGNKLISQLLFPERSEAESKGLGEYNSPQPSLYKREGAPPSYFKRGVGGVKNRSHSRSKRRDCRFKCFRISGRQIYFYGFPAA